MTDRADFDHLPAWIIVPISTNGCSEFGRSLEDYLAACGGKEGQTVFDDISFIIPLGEYAGFPYGGGGGGGGGAGGDGRGGPPQSPTAPSVPSLPPNAPPDQVKTFEDSFKEAIKRVQTKPSCAAVFGGESNATTAMYNANYRFLPVGAPTQQPDGTWTVTGAYTISSTNPQLVVINSQGPFANLGNPVLFVPGMSSPKRFDLGTGRSGRQLGAVILLHETGHLTHVFGPDSGSEKLQNRYTRQVLKGCF